MSFALERYQLVRMPVFIDIATLVRRGRKAYYLANCFFDFQNDGRRPRASAPPRSCHQCHNLAESGDLGGDRIAKRGGQMFIALGFQLAD
jgi:hypothetical protein